MTGAAELTRSDEGTLVDFVWGGPGRMCRTNSLGGAQQAVRGLFIAHRAMAIEAGHVVVWHVAGVAEALL